jgi:membrane-associated phospholipid phosphatase
MSFIQRLGDWQRHKSIFDHQYVNPYQHFNIQWADSVWRLRLLNDRQVRLQPASKHKQRHQPRGDRRSQRVECHRRPRRRLGGQNRPTANPINVSRVPSPVLLLLIPSSHRPSFPSLHSSSNAFRISPQWSQQIPLLLVALVALSSHHFFFS